MQCEHISYQVGSAETEPKTLSAGQQCSIRLCYTVGSIPIQAGGSIRVQIPIAFSKPQFKSPLEIGYTTAYCDNPNVKLSLALEQKTCLKDEIAYVTRWGRNVFIIVSDGELHENDQIYLYYGFYSANNEPPLGKALYAKASYFSGKHDFTVAVDTDGKRTAPFSGFYQVAKQPFVTVKPQHAVALRSVTPTTNSIDVHVVLLDKEKNPVTEETHFSVEDPEVNTVDGRRVMRCMVNCNGLQSQTNPSIEPILGNHIYWGDIHGHSKCSDGLGTPDDYYYYAQKSALLDFAALTDHGQELSDDDWEEIKASNKSYNNPGSFVTILGYEFSHPVKGDKNIYYPGEDGPLLREKAPFDIFSGNCFPLEDYVPSWKNYGAMMMFHQHAGKILKYYDSELVRLVEIYSNLGCCEQSGAMPIFLPSVNKDFSGNYVEDGLNAGYRVGFTANGDDHAGRPGGFDWHRVRRVNPGGLTAVYAKELTREAIFQALYSRHCYATTGARIAVDFQINGMMPGEVIQNAKYLNFLAFAAGTDRIVSLEIISNGNVIHQYSANKLDAAFQMDISEVNPGYYYLRVNQADGNRAWTSPIYVTK